MLPASSLNLSFVTVRRSCVVPFPVEELWSVVRLFGQVAAWLPSLGGKPVQATLMAGESDTTIGAIRCVQIGDNRIVEQLVSLNDSERSIRWKLISHPLNSNPFPASFVNCSAGQKLFPVTIGNTTFIELTAEFYTEPGFVSVMTKVFSDWFDEGFQHMSEHFQVLRQKALAMPQMIPGIGSTSMAAHAFMNSSMAAMGRPAAPGMLPPGMGVQPMMLAGQHAYSAAPSYPMPLVTANAGFTPFAVAPTMGLPGASVMTPAQVTPMTTGLTVTLANSHGSQSIHNSTGSEINPP